MWSGGGKVRYTDLGGPFREQRTEVSVTIGTPYEQAKAAGRSRGKAGRHKPEASLVLEFGIGAQIHTGHRINPICLVPKANSHNKLSNRFKKSPVM